MRQKRAKSYRKQMEYLHLNFKFREPYQVLLDEEIILECVKTRYDLVKGLERTLQAKVKPMITQCAMNDLYKTKNEEAIALAKTFERRRCGHIEKRQSEKEQEKKDDSLSNDIDAEVKNKTEKKDNKPKSAFDCMANVVIANGENKHRYVVATQKLRLRQLFRTIPAIPLIYMNRSVMIMEPMSPVTEQARARIENAKLNAGLNDVALSLNKRKADGEASEEDEEPKKKKRKGPKAPNPLSVKKKKLKSAPGGAAGQEESGEKSKRKRKHRGKGSSASEMQEAKEAS